MTDTPPSTPQNRIHSFGGRKGRPLRANMQQTLDEWMPKLRIDDAKSVKPTHPTVLEIGFGAGEHLAHRAENDPPTHYIGSEVFDQGVAQCVAHIAQKNLSNVQLYTRDGRELVDALPEKSIQTLYVLHPDPWPKRRHHKRRMIDQAQLKAFHRILDDDGEFCIATDHKDYANWIAVQMHHFAGFSWSANTATEFKTPKAGHIATRYETKGRKDGSTIVYLRYRKQ